MRLLASHKGWNNNHCIILAHAGSLWGWGSGSTTLKFALSCDDECFHIHTHNSHKNVHMQSMTLLLSLHPLRCAQSTIVFIYEMFVVASAHSYSCAHRRAVRFWFSVCFVCRVFNSDFVFTYVFLLMSPLSVQCARTPHFPFHSTIFVYSRIVQGSILSALQRQSRYPRHTR